MKNDRKYFVMLSLVGSIFLGQGFGCATDDTEADSDLPGQECGPFAHAHDNACHCEAGYVPNPSGAAGCVPDQHDHGTGTGTGTDTDHHDDGTGTGTDHHDDGTGTDHHTDADGRLLLADADRGQLLVVDVHDYAVIASLGVVGPARVYAESEQKYGFAVQGANDIVQGIHAGLSYLDHGDHWDITEENPFVFPTPAVSCVRPVHFVNHDGWYATFCDGDGTLRLFTEDYLEQSWPAMTLESGRPHHGVGVGAFGRILLSMPNLADEEDALPIGVQEFDLNGNAGVAYPECPGLHGEAATETFTCFGCNDGVLCLSQAPDGTLVSTKIANPADTPEGVRVGTLSASHGENNALIGNWGSDLVVVDPIGKQFHKLAVGVQILKFTLDHTGQFVWVLGADGYLSQFDRLTGAKTYTLQVMPTFVVEPGHGQPRPTFTLTSEQIFVLDPREARLRALSIANLQAPPLVLELPEGRYAGLTVLAKAPGH